ncbi:MAG: HAMP domain-containing protein [Desulfobacterales bacterium]|nr:HAMP domain-containing protein [Desulfobacterales bacterium]
MLAQTVSALIINELIYEKLGLVEEGGLIDNYMRGLYQHSELDLNFVAVLDNSFQVTSHSDFREFGKRYDNSFVKQAHSSDSVLVRRVTNNNDSAESLEFAAPLSIEGKRWGMLLFSLSLEDVEAEIRAMIYQIASHCVLALLVLFFLIYLLSQRFIKPIIDLSQAMGEVEVEMSEKTIPVKGNDELSHLTESFNDMVRRIRSANEEMKLAHEKLLESEKLATLGVLSSSIAHRINNPLGGLFNCVGLLHKQGDDQEFRQNYLGLIEEGLESIKQTVGQLLWTAGRRQGEDQRSNISVVLASVLRYLDYRLKRQRILFDQDIDSSLTAPIAPHDLEEVLLNTMINAIQAMKRGGNLSITARQINAQINIHIEDTGVGIPEDKIEDVFDIFYSTKKAGEGTGLGLWMTYELIKKYKGDITISSQVGVGTKVSIIIPEGA